jgi:hypothetical protein
MRQGQQNRRGRNRNNNMGGGGGGHNHRKNQNPLTRSYESNGPEMKVRGTPALIAEKYVSAARDALSSGDPVLAENYLQHAEHYNRIILAVRDQQGQGDMSGQPRPRPVTMNDSFEGGEGGHDEDGDIADTTAAPLGQPRLNEQPQPRFELQPRNFDQPRYEDRPQRMQSEPRQHRDRPDRGERMDRPERSEREPRPERTEFADRPERAERSERPAYAHAQAGEASAPAPRGEGQQPRRRERFNANATTHEQPEFLRRPVRRPRREAAADQPEGGPPAPAGSDDGE